MYISKCNNKNSLWFTLVELMVVIAVIGVLGAALFPSMWSYFERARQTEARVEMRQISQLIFDAQTIRGEALRWVTNHSCSLCQCNTYTGSLLEVPSTHVCFTRWQNAIDKIVLATGSATWIAERYYRDPWNAPYLLDENEDENANCDILRSSFWNIQTTSWWVYTIKLLRFRGGTCL